MIIKKYDLRRTMDLMRFGKEYITNVEKIVDETGKYDDKYIHVENYNKSWNKGGEYLSYELK